MSRLEGGRDDGEGTPPPPAPEGPASREEAVAMEGLSARGEFLRVLLDDDGDRGQEGRDGDYEMASEAAKCYLRMR